MTVVGEMYVLELECVGLLVDFRNMPLVFFFFLWNLGLETII